MIIGFIQARMNSNRLPGKAMLPIGDKPLIAHVIGRAKQMAGLDRIYLATSDAPENDVLAARAGELGIHVMRGPEDDVIARVAKIIADCQPDHLVRLTGDNPLIDPKTVAAVLENHLADKADYSCATGFAVGTAVDIYTRKAMQATIDEADGEKLADHTDLHVLERPDRFRLSVTASDVPHSAWRFTVDTAEDLDRIRQLHQWFAEAGKDMAQTSITDIMQFISDRGEVGLFQPVTASVSPENLYTADLVGNITTIHTARLAGGSVNFVN